MALAVLGCTPFPQDFVGKQADELLAIYREVEGLKSPQRLKVLQLLELASKSIGITEAHQMARLEITILVRRYDQLEQEIEEISYHLTELVKTSVEYEALSTVPGLGDTTIVDLLAEIRSFSHYQDPRQLIKLAGLTLHERRRTINPYLSNISKYYRRKIGNPV